MIESTEFVRIIREFIWLWKPWNQFLNRDSWNFPHPVSMCTFSMQIFKFNFLEPFSSQIEGYLSAAMDQFLSADSLSSRTTPQLNCPRGFFLFFQMKVCLNRIVEVLPGTNQFVRKLGLFGTWTVRKSIFYGESRTSLFKLIFIWREKSSFWDMKLHTIITSVYPNRSLSKMPDRLKSNFSLVRCHLQAQLMQFETLVEFNIGVSVVEFSGLRSIFV